MPRTYSSIDKIRTELAWVMKRQIKTSADAATSGAVKKPATSRRMYRLCRNEVLDVSVGVLLCDVS
jgi:hypothetical protein